MKTGGWQAARAAHRWFTLLLPLLVAGAYSNSLTGAFIGDDYPAIVDNPDIRTIGGSLRAFFDDRQSSVSGRPVVSLTLALNYALDGLNVRGYRAANIAIHTLTTLALFGLVRRTLQSSVCSQEFNDRTATALAAAVAAVWSVHPLHTESVNYVVQRTELLAGLFIILTLYCAARGYPSCGRGWSAAAAVFCALAMLSKETAAGAPLLVLLYDYTFQSPTLRRVLRHRPALYASLAACWVLLAIILFHGPRSASVGFDHKISWWPYLLTQAGVIAHYLRLAAWPAPLVVSYHDWPVADGLISVLPQAVLIVVLLVTTGVGIIARKWWGFLGACFFIILAPSSSFVPIVTEVAAERRMYLPLLAVILVAGGALSVLARRLAATDPRKVLLPLAIPAVAALALTTWLRNLDYRTSIDIWADAAMKRPGNPVAHGAVGYGLKQAGRLEEALQHQREAVRLDPDYADGYFHMGHILQLLGRREESVAAYQRVLRLDPAHEDAWYNLGLTLQQSGRSAEAVHAFEALLRIRPQARAYRAAAVCLHALGRGPVATQMLRKAISLQPDSTEARFNLGWILAESGDYAGAAEQYRTVVSLRPGDVEARFRLGLALEALGQKAAAEEAYRQVLQARPDHPGASQRLKENH